MSTKVFSWKGKNSIDYKNNTPFWKDNSFLEFIYNNPKFKIILELLLDDLKFSLFERQNEIEKLASSYIEHGYGYLFYLLIKTIKPEKCVELGVLHGFSSCTIASALRDNGSGVIHAYDLFEDYPFRNDSMINVTNRMKEYNLDKWVEYHKNDAFEVSKKYKEIDFLHVDLSNDGVTYEKIFKQWHSKVKSLIVLEGGADYRDKVAWMGKYKKVSICQTIEHISQTYPQWKLYIIYPYPSLTIAVRN